jgi:4-hydroxybenzoyl-CoA reductase subunit beta
MMRCSSFTYRAPSTIAEAVKILDGEGARAMVLAGGTDLVPNMKRRQQSPAVLVALRRIAGLREATLDGTGAILGAGLTLAAVAGDRRLAPWAALGRAAGSVATPHIRNSGTLGGNLCLDTRCNYYNQGYEWRSAIDFCMKRGGGAEDGIGWPVKNEQQVCWVAPGSPRCWAVSSTDSAPALIALGAEVELVSARGSRILPLAALFHDDGIDYLAKRRDELLTTVRLPDPTGWRSTYWKLRRREAFDFPVLGVAAAVKCAPDGTVEAARLVLGAVASHPVVAQAAERLVGQQLTDEAIAQVADEAVKLAKPLDNTDFQLGWRKRVAKAYITGALREVRGDDPGTLGLHARRATALRPLD